MNSSLTITVLIPSWKRPKKLQTCLEHLMKQSRTPDQIIVVLRSIDSEGIAVAERFSKLMKNFIIVEPDSPGVVAAENAGLSKVTSSYVAFLDDDGYAPVNWLSQIEDFFSKNPAAAAYGGSDIIMSEPWTYHDYLVDHVGILTWYGKVIGNHHRKCSGSIRKVNALKGVNMIFKRNSFDFLDEKLAGIDGLMGNGSQWEFELCLRVQASGGDIFFDPTLVVTHDSDHSQHHKSIAAMNNAHNLSYVMIKHLLLYKYIIFLFYALILGGEQLPGMIKCLIDILKLKSIEPIRIYFYKLYGFFQGILTYIKS